MRHAMRSQRLSRPSDHRAAMVGSLVKSLIQHKQVTTTLARAKEGQRVADRLVSLGKEGSLHARRQAYRLLQDRTLVKTLFTEIAPLFTGIGGGYTRVLRVSIRRGDGAQQALLAFSRMSTPQPAVATEAGPQPKQTPAPAAPSEPKPTTQDAKKSRGLLENLRGLWTRKQRHT